MNRGTKRRRITIDKVVELIEEAEAENLSWVIDWSGEQNCIADSGTFKFASCENEEKLLEAERLVHEKFNTDMVLQLNRKIMIGVMSQVRDRIHRLRARG